MTLKKTVVVNACDDPNSIACKRATRKSMRKVFNDMANGTAKVSSRSFFFKHSGVSLARSKWMRLPRLKLNFSTIRESFLDNDYTSRFKVNKESDGSGNTIYTHDYSVVQ